MESVRRLKFIVGVYFVVLGFLMLAVIAMPLVVQGDITIARGKIIGEEILETSLILILFIVSSFILKGFKNALQAYQHAVDQAGQEKTRLISNLAEAFHYIGTVNVEFKEIQSILCGVERYPKTRKELKLLLNRLASHAMMVAKTPWAAFRIIERDSKQTISEYSAHRYAGDPFSPAIGNRAILAGHRNEGFRTVETRQTNLDLHTVCILPAIPLSEEQLVLISAMVNQVELLFMLGCQNPLCEKIPFIGEGNERNPYHDLHQ